MSLLLRWFLNAITIILLAYLLPGIAVSGLYAALIAALVLGLINAFLRPVIIFLTLPINIITLGLFTFVINALMFWFASSIVKGFSVDGFWTAFWGAIIMSLVNWISGSVIKKN